MTTVFMLAASTANLNADCKCDKWLNGPEICKEYSKLNPNYWACRTLFGTMNQVCTAMLCSSRYEGKLEQNQQACKKNGNEKACQDELEKDVNTAVNDMGKDFKDKLPNIQAELKKEADNDACIETTGKPCENK
ncbi:MAG: hypothetical protein K2P93_02280 [Alphaproteobacteria bacterium]|nr:hypothetical protein [Alphaproteobacteria bacterium]